MSSVTSNAAAIWSWALACLVLGFCTPTHAQEAPASSDLWPSLVNGPTTVPVPVAQRNALKPYVAFAWSPTARLPHIEAMCWIGLKNNMLDMQVAARKMRPGCRVFLANSLTDGLLDQPEDRCRDAAGNFLPYASLWPERGIQIVTARCDAIFHAIAQAGGGCDLLALDAEIGFTNWAMTREHLHAIASDPRFGPVAVKLAFADCHTVDDIVDRVFIFRKYPEYHKWNSVTSGIVGDAVNRSVATPLWHYFPHALVCNYEGILCTPANASADLNGVYDYFEGPLMGNVAAPSAYGQASNITHNGTPGDWKSPFAPLLLTANRVRGCYRSSPVPIIPWIGFRSYVGDDVAHPNILFGNTDYWQENVIHLLLSGGSNNVLYFDPRGGAYDIFAKPTPDDQALNDVLADLEQQAHGHPLVKPLLTEPLEFTVKWLASAAVTDDGRTVARVTFAPGVDAADVTIAGKTIHVTCPAGKVGAWVEVK